MRLCEVPGMGNVLSVSGGLEHDRLWLSESERMSSTSIQLFYARAGLKGQREQAIEMIDQAQAVVIRSLFDGSLPENSFTELVLHEPPPPPYMADEFVGGLIKLRPARRGATIFALETKLDPKAVSEMTWHELDRRGLSPMSLEVLQAAQGTRHIKLPYVFWEWATESIACPLLGLGPSIEKAFGCTLAELQGRYDRMILIDRRAEGASLLSLTKQVDG